MPAGTAAFPEQVDPARWGAGGVGSSGTVPGGGGTDTIVIANGTNGANGSAGSSVICL